MNKKMKFALVGLCMGAFMMLAMGCASSQGAGFSVPDGMVAYEGDTLTVELESNPTTGYEWACEIDGSAVVAESDEYVAASQGGEAKEGEGGTHTFVFKADGSGEATITLKYARSWESTDDDKTLVLKATVDNGKFTQVDN